MTKRPWWQEAVFYQIYPRSFADGNGDGVGDLPGLLARLDYLRGLGVDALWLSPHYPSPQFDCGYDVADYTGVAPEYGTLDDFRRFLDGAHQRGLRVILDFVLNHTSDQHPWFVESRASRHSPRRDWYVWADGRDGGPPNNWLSIFGGPAWTYDPATDQYYYHFFFKQQPDLNWRNPAVKAAMFDAARFWLDLGVDGFRLDAIGTVYEDPSLADHASDDDVFTLGMAMRSAQTPEERAALGRRWQALLGLQHDRPETHALMRELRAVVEAYPGDRVLVGETDNVAFYGSGDDELHLVFNFPLMRTNRLTPAWVRANQAERLGALPPGAWPCNTLGNHDSPRVFSRYGDGVHDAALARLSLALVLTLPGTPFLYNGEEIGMTDLLLDDLDAFRDMLGVWYYHAIRGRLGVPHAEAVRSAAEFGRDKCRTPMQWANAPNGGFCPPGVSPWLPVNPNYAAGVNVAEQDTEPGSLLNFYRALLRLRRETPALRVGTYQDVLPASEDCLVFARTAEAQTCLVALNMSESPQVVDLAGLGEPRRVLFSSAEPPALAPAGPLALAPFEVVIIEMNAPS